MTLAGQTRVRAAAGGRERQGSDARRSLSAGRGRPRPSELPSILLGVIGSEKKCKKARVTVVDSCMALT
eukprot:5077219-Prymnesium_polylepis.1